MAPAPRPRRRLAALVGLVAAVLLATGCQVKTDVALAVRPDGSGTVTVTVTLDKEAAAQVPDLASQLRVADLRKAGWTVVGPRATADGGFVVQARKGFTRADDAGRVLAELLGRGQGFRDFRITRSRSFASRSTSVHGTIDLSQGVDAFSDAGLTSLLGTSFGRPPAELQALAKGPLAGAAPFTLHIQLPDGGSKVVSATLGGPAVPVTATSHHTNLLAWLLLAGAALAVLLAIAAVIDSYRRPDRRLPRPSERGMGAYPRRTYDPIENVEDGPAHGVGGAAELVRVQPVEPPPFAPRRPPRPKPTPPPPSRPRRPPGDRPPPRREPPAGR